MNAKLQKVFVLLATPFLVLSDSVHAGLEANWGEILIQNIPIGAQIDTEKDYRAQLIILNTGDHPIDLRLLVERPLTHELKPGYEPIPSADWVWIDNSKGKVLPGNSFETGIVLRVPKDKAFLGKQYQFWIHSIANSGGFVEVGVKSRILLHISEETPKKDERKSSREAGSLAFSRTPEVFRLENADLGKIHVLSSEGEEGLLIRNEDQVEHLFKVEVLDPKEKGLTADQGYEFPDEVYLKIVPSRPFKIAPGGQRRIHIQVDLPNDPSLHGKKHLYFVRIAQGSASYLTRVYWEVKP